MYDIELSEEALEDLEGLRSFDRGPVVDAIEDFLACEPTVQTRRRKILHGVVPPFEAKAPLWELRIGEHRVYYDVDEEARKVYVRAIRRKRPHRTTEETL